VRFNVNLRRALLTGYGLKFSKMRQTEALSLLHITISSPDWLQNVTAEQGGVVEQEGHKKQDETVKLFSYVVVQMAGGGGGDVIVVRLQ
jgi:hypothetical protein